jgi:NTE family protein
MRRNLSPYAVLLSIVMYILLASYSIHGFILQNGYTYSVNGAYSQNTNIGGELRNGTLFHPDETISIKSPSVNAHSVPVASLSLSGGGAYGAFQVGCLKALLEENIVTFDTIDTISVGGLIGSFLAQYNMEDQYEGVMELERIWHSIVSNRNIYKHWRFSFIEGILYRNGLYNPSPLSKMIRTNLDTTKLTNSNVDFHAATTDIQTGNMVVFDKQDANIADAVLAGCSIPVMFPPVKIENNLYVDAGIKRYFWGTYLNEPCKPTVVITTSYNESECDKVLPKNMLGYGASVIRVFMDSLYVEDMSRFMNRDNVYVIRPRQKLKGQGMTFRKQDILENIDIGYKQTKLMISSKELNILTPI